MQINKQNMQLWLTCKFLDFLLMSFCFIMKKDNFKQKLLLWPQVPFKDNRYFFEFIFYNFNISIFDATFPLELKMQM